MGAQILVADDSVTIQKVVELTFSKEDFTLIQARSGEETLRKAKESRPDLILLDLVMPDKDGYEVCAALRDDPTLRTVPIILLTGTFESFDRQRGAQAGANDFVSKPFESQILIGKVKQLLFAKALEEAAPAIPSKTSSEAASPMIAPAPTALAPPSLRVPSASVESNPWEEAPASVAAAAAGSLEGLERFLDDMPSQAANAEPWEAPGELRLEDLTMSPTLEAPDLSSLDLESLGLEPAERQPAPLAVESSAAPAADVEVLPSSERLILEDMLSEAGTEAPTAASQGEEPAETPDPAEPVFELSVTEALPLPMVETGKGEPPTLSVEDLLGAHTPDIAVSQSQAQEVLALDLAALADDTQPAAQVSAEPLPSAETFALEFPAGLPPEETPAAPEAGRFESPVRAEDLETPVSIQSLEEVLPGLAESFESAVPLVTPPVQGFEAAPAEATAATSAAGASAAVESAVSPQEAPPAYSLEPPAFDVAAMREEVTARVVHDLRRELSEKLLERFEKIVWEVVPDLAELLISKEIERIRLLAEEEKDHSS